jgi:Lysyl oxidase
MVRRAAVVGAAVLAAFALVAAVIAAEPPDEEATNGAPSTRSASASPSATEETAPEADPRVRAALLPNMRSLDARDLRLQVTPAGRRLRFAGWLANVGSGPLVLLPRGRRQCGPREHSATQILYRDRNEDGTYQRDRDQRTRRRFAGCMLRHAGHDHWHFDAMAAYSLRRPGTTSRLAARPKVSFCLRDNTRVEGVPTTVRREHFGDCTARGVQGISPGWIDVYGPDLDGQWLRLPRGVDREVLCLDVEADPRDLVRESDESDNATTVAVRVAGREVRRVPRARCT